MKPLKDMNLNELNRYREWLYEKIASIECEKEMKKNAYKKVKRSPPNPFHIFSKEDKEDDLKNIKMNILHTEDELGRLKKIRKKLLKEIEMKGKIELEKIRKQSKRFL